MRLQAWSSWKRSRLAVCLLIALFVVQLAAQLVFVPDMAHWDEWDIWYGWDSGLWKWLWARHNEHMVVPTKLHMALMTAVFGAHPKLIVVTSFLFYGFMVGYWERVFRWVAPGNSSTVMVMFLMFLLSTLPVHNHISGFHSQFHFVLFFLLLALPLLFSDRPTVWRIALGTLSCLAMVVSFATGLAQAAAVVFMHLAYRFTKRRENRWAYHAAWVSFLIVAFVSVWWLQGHHKVPGHPSISRPHSTAFIRFFLNLVSYGFGVETVKNIWGVLILVVIAIPLVALLARGDGRGWGLGAGVAAIFGAIATVAVGRAGFGAEAAKSARYSEIALFLIPLTVCLWCRWLAAGSVFRKRFLAVLWVILFVSFVNNWTLHAYGNHYRIVSAGTQCLKSHPQIDKGVYCPELYPAVLTRQLARIKAAGAAFYLNALRD